MKNNKEWFEILREFRNSDVCIGWINTEPEKINELYDFCKITPEDYMKYNEEKDYRALVAALYFTTYIRGMYVEAQSAIHNPYSYYCSCLSMVLYRHSKHLNRSLMKIKKTYPYLRKKYNISYPEQLSDIPGYVA